MAVAAAGPAAVAATILVSPLGGHLGLVPWSSTTPNPADGGHADSVSHPYLFLHRLFGEYLGYNLHL